MKRVLNLQGKRVDYVLKVSNRARRLRLAVYCDGSFVVTTPRILEESILERYIQSKATWIVDKLEYFRSVPIKELLLDGDGLKEHKEKAFEIVQERLIKFNKVYNFKFNKVEIKEQKTIWGSCSKKGNLNFNFKIAFLPPRLVDYIVVHELCHLDEFSHSMRFWNLVRKAIPDFEKIGTELKEKSITFF